MAKYIIETDDENLVELNGQELYRVKGFPWMALSDNDLDKLEPVEEGFPGNVAGYSAGIRDGIVAAQRVWDMSDIESLKCFGLIPARVLNRIEPRDVVRMLKEYDEELNAEIMVGDEVIVRGKEAEDKAVVTGAESPMYYLVWKNGRTGIANRQTTHVIRTGRHFDQIAKVLDEVRGC